MEKERVLFVCTHNSARSQMAEGLLRADYGDRYEAYSAGTVATRVKPLAIEASCQEAVLELFETMTFHLDNEDALHETVKS